MLKLAWTYLKASLICAFVIWHLFVLFLRNPLDLWWKPMEEWAKQKPWWDKVYPYYHKTDRLTWRYENFCGVEQGWSMFTPPLARSAPFLAARIEFDDGSREIVISENEPDPTRYFRSGGWRQRKLEDYMIGKDEADIAESDERIVWERYIRWSVRRWKEWNPEDKRTPIRVDLIKRRIYFPKPEEDKCDFEDPYLTDIASFDPDGRLRERR